MKQCVSFLVWKGLVEPNEAFFSSTPHVNAPWRIAAWIMNHDAIKSACGVEREQWPVVWEL